MFITGYYYSAVLLHGNFFFINSFSLMAPTWSPLGTRLVVPWPVLGRLGASGCALGAPERALGRLRGLAWAVLGGVSGHPGEGWVVGG